MQQLTDELLQNSKVSFYVTVLSPSVIGMKSSCKIESGEVYRVNYSRVSSMFREREREIVLEAQNMNGNKIVTTALHRFRLSYKNEVKLWKQSPNYTL